MKPVLTVFRKELTDVMRDRRTLVFMLVIPTVAIPVLMYITTELMTHFLEKLAREKADVLVLNPGAAPDLVEELRSRASLAGRARGVAELLEEKGLTEKDLAMTKGNRKAFLDLLRRRNIDPDELTSAIRGTAGVEKLDMSPGSIISMAFPPNFRIVTRLDDPELESLDEARDREELLQEAVRREVIDAAVEFDPDTRDKLAGLDAARVTIFYLQTSDRSNAARKGLKSIFASMGKDIVEQRLVAQELPPGFASPLQVRTEALPGASVLLKILGQILPYMILIFAFAGALYPAIDLGAGEKERGTLETLLVAPVGRLSLVVGKFLVVLVAAMVSAVLATASLAVSLQLGIFSTLSVMGGDAFTFKVTEALTAVLMVLPISCIFAALLLALSIFAKSFKEGQSYASPLQMVIILPAFVSFIPGVKLDWLTSSIPVVNVSLALKEIFTGNLDQHWAHVGVIFLSTSVFAGLLLWFAAWWFQREQVLFRS